MARGKRGRDAHAAGAVDRLLRVLALPSTVRRRGVALKEVDPPDLFIEIYTTMETK